jgi:hypothetical protein
MTTDLLGTPLTETEQELLAVYRALLMFVGRDDLAPVVRAGALAALAPLAVTVTDLGLAFEHLIDVGA